LGFPYNISATAEASDFKLDAPLGLPRNIIKSHAEEKGRGPGLGELPKIRRFITPTGKLGYGLGLGELPKIFGFPVIFLQRL